MFAARKNRSVLKREYTANNPAMEYPAIPRQAIFSFRSASALGITSSVKKFRKQSAFPSIRSNSVKRISTLLFIILFIIRLLNHKNDFCWFYLGKASCGMQENTSWKIHNYNIDYQVYLCYDLSKQTTWSIFFKEVSS